MRIKIISGLLGLFLFLFITSVSAYQIDYYVKDNGTTSPVTAYAPSIYWTENCDANVWIYGTGKSTTNQIISHTYYSPDSTVKTTFEPITYSNNFSCKLFNAVPLTAGDSLNNFYENSVKTTFTSTSLDTWLKITYECDFNSDEYFIYSNTNKTDSYGNHPFAYGKKFGTCFAQSPSQCTNTLTSDLNSVINYLNDGFKICGNDLRIDKEGDEYHITSCGSIVSDISMNYWVMIPFNSMETGKVIINISDSAGYKYNAGIGGTIAYEYQYYAIDLSDNTTYDLGTTNPLNTEIELTPNTDYWLLIGTRIYMDNYNCGSGANWGIVYNYSNYIISIWAYEPDWECSEWSECDAESGYKQRNCTDKNGKVADKIETEICSIPSLFSKKIGFEEGTFKDFFLCYPNYNCVDELQTITQEIPENWTLSGSIGTSYGYVTAYLENYAYLTNQYYSNGTRSLLMQYIPPKPHEPIFDNSSYVVCGNKTIGAYPLLSHPYNKTLFLETNITFPSENPEIRLDIKRCPQIVAQYDTTDRGVNFFGFTVWNQSCGKMCYDGADCSKTIHGKWGLLLTGWHNVTTDVNWDYEYWSKTVNHTSKVKELDGIIADNLYIKYPAYYNNITLINGNLFTNGTKINMYGNFTSIGKLQLVNPDTLDIYAEFDTETSNNWFNSTLENISIPIKSILMINGTTTAFYSRIDYVEILNPENHTLQYVDWRYYPQTEAPEEWTNTIIQIPQNVLNLDENGTFTLSLTVNPFNKFDYNYHCVLFDNIWVTVGETSFNAENCNSTCSGTTYYERTWTGDTCITEIKLNDEHCINKELEAIKEAIKNNETGKLWECYEGTYYEWLPDLKEWHIEENSTICQEEEAEQTETETTATQSLLYVGYGISFGVFDFFLSIFMIVNYLIITISTLVIHFTKKWEAGLITIIILIFGAVSASVYPVWIGLLISIAIILLFAYKMSEVAKGGG